MNNENVRIALRGIYSNRLRAFLTMLGILIGVASVIVLVAVGTGSSQQIRDRLSSLGTNSLTIFRGGGFGRGGANRNGTQSQAILLNAKDVTALSDPINAPDIKAVSPVRTATATASYNGATYSPGTFEGVLPVFGQIKNLPVSTGRFIDQADQDAHANVVVLGQTVVLNLFGSATANAVGAEVKFGNATLQVIGVLKSKGSNGAQDQDDVAIAPLSTVEDHYTGATTSYSQILAQANSSSAATSAVSEVTSILDADHKITNPTGNEFRVLNQADLLATQTSNNRTFTILLGMVAAISLLVGGIGVMNIMLVTVTERTREIGIRKAIGARRSDILSQFLVEAVLLSVFGGLLGVVGGLVGSNFKIVGIQPQVQGYSVLLAFGVALVTGLFFGIYPANRAASLRPIDALRYE